MNQSFSQLPEQNPPNAEPWKRAERLRAISVLAEGIAHDFNNILAAIAGYTEMTMADVAPESLASQNLQEILIATDRARDLVTHIQTLSRMEDGELQPIALHLVLNETMKLLRASLPPSIKIQRSLVRERDVVSVDPVQIEQLLIMLCATAWRGWESAGGTLRVSLEAPAEGAHSVLLTITATPASPGEGPVNSGTPPTACEIVERHGGILTAEADAAGKVSYRISLPSAALQPAEEGFQTPEPESARVRRVLLVDEEEALVRLYLRMLDAMGFQTQFFTRSTIAYQAFLSDPDGFDLVITDWTMPHIDGLELARKIRGIRPDLPVILCTGISANLRPEADMNSAFVTVLPKPFLMKDLACAVQAAQGAAANREGG